MNKKAQIQCLDARHRHKQVHLKKTSHHSDGALVSDGWGQETRREGSLWITAPQSDC